MITHVMGAVARGLHVFPAQVNGKRPHHAVGDWRDAATNDPARVAAFWSSPVGARANYAVACKPSGLLVVDLDQAKEPGALAKTEWAYLHDAYGPYVHGEELFDEMCYRAGSTLVEAKATFTVRTRSGGLHLYYRWDPSWPKVSQSSPVKGIVDVRGNGGDFGGYVIGPGSSVDGQEYRVESDAPIAPPPRWIAQLVVEKPAPPRQPKPQGLRQPGAVSWAGLVEAVRSAHEGNRNNALHWAARAMCSDGATEQECKDTLTGPAEENGLTGFEIERTIQSSYRVQRQKDGTS